MAESSRLSNSISRLRRTLADTRSVWNDTARREFDHQFAEPLELEMTAISSEVERLERFLDEVEKQMRY